MKYFARLNNLPMMGACKIGSAGAVKYNILEGLITTLLNPRYKKILSASYRTGMVACTI